MRNKKKLFLWMDFGLAFLLIVLDQITKYYAVVKLKGKEAFVILDGVFELDYLENRGSAFGMFQNQKIFLLVVGVLFMAIMVFLLIRTPAEKKYLLIHLTASGVVAGGLGNMIDRFRLGYVVDFFSFVWIHFPIFNVADIYIVVSTIVIAVLLLFVYREEDIAFLSVKKKTP